MSDQKSTNISQTPCIHVPISEEHFVKPKGLMLNWGSHVRADVVSKAHIAL